MARRLFWLVPGHPTDLNLNKKGGIIMRLSRILSVLFATHLTLLMSCGGDTEGELIGAVERGDVSTFEALLEEGADVNTQLGNRKSILMLAAEKGDPEIVRLLLDKGAEVRGKDFDGFSALLYAAKEGHGEAWRLLLSSYRSAHRGWPLGSGRLETPARIRRTIPFQGLSQ